MSSKHEVAALRYADDFVATSDLHLDTMPREERRAWVAALEYARSMGEEDTAARVDFAIHCNGRTDLDNAWEEWS
jgi:hypothetical protein